MEQAEGVEDHSRRTKSALKRIMFYKGILKWMQFSIFLQSLDGNDSLPLDILHRDLTTPDSPIFDESGTGSTETSSTAVFDSRNF
jgi:hypothetical protein